LLWVSNLNKLFYWSSLCLYCIGSYGPKRLCTMHRWAKFFIFYYSHCYGGASFVRQTKVRPDVSEHRRLSASTSVGSTLMRINVCVANVKVDLSANLFKVDKSATFFFSFFSFFFLSFFLSFFFSFFLKLKLSLTS